MVGTRPPAVPSAAVLTDSDGAVVILPAAIATPAAIHFVIRHSSGLVHAVMPSTLLDSLRIPDQPVLTAESSGISFTVAVDAASGIGTGISASDRARTLRVLADPRTTCADLVRPGHVLPIRCSGDESVEMRLWERALRLVTDSGYPPVAVAARLIDDAGEPLDAASAASFALWHGLPVDPVLGP
ncbi:hypothetical protein A8M60_01880 [Nocardia farcinica]|nr:hypothetical protein A8M60_01880 [Nocardia farcinica]